MPNMTANAPVPPSLRGPNDSKSGRQGVRRVLFSKTGIATAVSTLAAVGLVACSTSYLSLRAAYKPKPASDIQPTTPPGSPPLKLYAGDTNFRLPEGDFRLHKDIRKIVDNIHHSGLDFVFFTPRVNQRFFEKDGTIDDSIRKWKDVRQFLDTIPEPKPLFLPGVEYQDRSNGSVSLLFLDLPVVFSDLRAREFRNAPQLFFYTAKAFGALLMINTPLATPLQVPVETEREKYATTDRSWHPFTESGRTMKDFPQEIQAAHELAYAVEAYSLPVSIWRDQYGLDDSQASLREILRVLDKIIIERKRRMVPTAGSDSRGRILHPMMYIAAPSRTSQSLREGLLRGRVCIRSPEPCGLRVYADDDAIPQGVGAALRARQRVEFAWKGEGELFKNGESAGNFDGRATIAADPNCSVYRLAADGGYSAPIYINCPWAESELPL